MELWHVKSQSGLETAQTIQPIQTAIPLNPQHY